MDMKNQSVTLQQLKDVWPLPNAAQVETALAKELALFNGKIVVIDDDPTGVQTVYGVSVYTDWEAETIRDAFEESERMFFILSNSRAFTAEQTAAEHRKIARNVIAASKASGKDFLLISRGDSTLRGHYPLENQVLRDTLEEDGQSIHMDIIIPFFPEGGRFTCGDIHYVQEGELLIPAGETEFAKDKTFGYQSSNLREWVEEKTGGQVPAQGVLSISLKQLREQQVEQITSTLERAEGFCRVVVNALDYLDLKVFTTALLQARRRGKRFLLRTAAGFTKVVYGKPDRPLLSREELVAPGNKLGGMVIVGSHVKKTSRQLERLRELPRAEMIQLDQHLILKPEAFHQEIQRVIQASNEAILQGKTAVVFTRRERLDINTGNPEDELRIAVEISGALIDIVKGLSHPPAFLVAKGGITSSDIGVKALGVRKATVMGQILPGIPVWKTGPESRYPGMSYVIFPGNVGKEEDLKLAVETMSP